MKRNIIVSSITVFLLLMAGMQVMAQENIAVDLYTDKTGNIFSYDESPVVKISIGNADGVEKNTEISWKLLNSDTGDLADYGNETLVIESGKTQIAEIETDCKEYGLYELQATVSWESGSVSDKLKLSKILTSEDGESNNDFGFASHVWRYGSYLESVELMKKAGAGGWSDGITWVKAEPEKGDFYLNSANVKVFEASKSNTENMLILGFGHPGYVERYDNAGNKIEVSELYPPITEEELEAFGRYCAYIAEKTKGSVNRFQIWNEWELEGFNPERLDGEYYVQILKTAYNAIKSVNRKAEVVGMGGAIITSTGEFDIAALEAGALDYCDAVSIHIYDYHRMTYFPNKRVIEDVQERVNLYRSYMKDREIPVYISETGWSTTSTAESLFASPYSEKEQAENLVKSFVTMKAFGLADKMYWYDFQDDGEDEAEREHRFGVVTSRYNEEGALLAKPAYVATAAMNKIMSGGVHSIENDKFESYTETKKMTSIWGDYKRIDAYVTGVFPFERDNAKSTMGRNVSVLWSNGQKQFKISTGSKTIDRYDMYGNRQVLESDNGIFNISIDNEIIYLSGDFQYFNINNQSVTIEDVSYDECKNMLTVKGTTVGMSEFYIELYENGTSVQRELCGVREDGSFERIINVNKNGSYTITAGKDAITKYGVWDTAVTVQKSDELKMNSQLGGVIVSGEGNNIKLSGQLTGISGNEEISVMVVPAGKSPTPENIIYINQVIPEENGAFTDNLSVSADVKAVDIYVGANYADRISSEYSYDICRVISFELDELNNEMIASAIVENLTDTEKEHTIIIAQYGDKGRLCGIETKLFTVQPKKGERQSLTFSMPKDSAAETCSAFIWDSTGTMTPLFKNAKVDFTERID